MVIMKKLILLAYFYRVCLCGELKEDADSAKRYLVELKEKPAVFHDSDSRVLNATLFKMVKLYYCHSRVQTNGVEELLLYGTKAWTFPYQDVNLTLRYPSENQQYEDEVKDHVDFVLTAIRVEFYLSGPDSRGFITSGGMHQDHISMTFVFRNLTNLSYQLYIHGMPRHLLNLTEVYNSGFDLC